MKHNDVITTEVIRYALETIADEMRVALRRTSSSVVVRDMLDFSCALFDSRGRLLATAVDIPSLIASMGPAIRCALEKWGDDIAPGDVLMTNHPYMGGGHTSDITLFVPVFDGEGRRVAFAGTTSHHADWGGRVAGTAAAGNSSLFEEGVLIPAIKLEEEGRANKAVLDIIAANVRHPNQNLGDLRGQLAAARTGERRMRRLVESYGLERYSSVADMLISYVADRTAAAISDLPDGTYSAEGFLDNDGHPEGKPVRLVAHITINGGAMKVDLTESDAQMAGGMNIPAASVQSAVHYAVKCLLPDDIPFNDGSLEPVEIVTKPGTVVNPTPPAAVSDRHLANQRLADVLTRALGNANPSNGSAGWFVGWPVLVIDSRSPRTGDEAVLLANVAGGAGATADHDGADALDVHLANCAIVPAEVVETSYELRVEAYRLACDTGGPGRHRGGLGIVAEYRVLSPDPRPFILEAEQTNPEFAPTGLEGGRPGAAGRIELVREGKAVPIAPKGQYLAAANDLIRLCAGGGGGYGDPLTRELDAIEQDVRDGRVSVEMAEQVYGAKVDSLDNGLYQATRTGDG